MTFLGLVTTTDLSKALQPIQEALKKMATQDDINSLQSQVQQVGTDLQTSVQTLQAELNQLASANPNVDLSGLQSAVSTLDEQAKAVGNLAPETSPPAV